MCGLCEIDLTKEHLARERLSNLSLCPICGRFPWNPEECDCCYHCAMGDADCVYCHRLPDTHIFTCKKCGRPFLSSALEWPDSDVMCGLCLIPYLKTQEVV